MPDKTIAKSVFYILLYLVVFFASAVAASQILLRGELVTVPDLVGKTLDEARADAARKKTTLAVQGYQYDSRYERGRVIGQDPPATSRVKSHRSVKIVLSEGSEKVAMPKLEGRSLEWATQALKDAGLRKGRVSQIHTSQYAAGRIIAQYPAAETTLPRGAGVNFLVSQGAWEPYYIMPDLIEKKSSSVLRQLQELDFKVAEIHPSYYPGWDPGFILKQFPIHGFKVQKKNQIALEVSK
ncbi:MAG: PASTA domain-containing protein [Candidatus Aminicenantales bacterium]|jgi:serine/threonine-protein kinase